MIPCGEGSLKRSPSIIFRKWLENKMNKCFEYHTSIGPFYIVNRHGRYHAVHEGASIASCLRADELAAVLGYGYRFKLREAEGDEIDTSGLGIPPNLSDWICCYFTPDVVRVEFKQHSGPGS
jgi:hypothetical protein